MIRHVWSVLSQSASFDAQTNSVSLLNVIEAATIFGEPTSKRPAVIFAELVSLWFRQDDDTPVSGQMRIFYQSPDGKKADPINLEIPDGTTPYHHTRITLSGFPVKQTGLYLFFVEYQLQGEKNWNLAATIPMLVVNQSPPVSQES